VSHLAALVLRAVAIAALDTADGYGAYAQAMRAAEAYEVAS